MTIVISSFEQRATILKQMAKQYGGILKNVQVLSMPAYFHDQKNDSLNHCLQIQRLLRKHEQEFDIYREMIAYPKFIEEIYRFSCDALRYGITVQDLPDHQIHLQELKRMLGYVFELPFIEKQYASLKEKIMKIQNDPNVIVHDYFEIDDYYAQIKESLNIIQHLQNPKIERRFAATQRVEIEAIAQDICRNEKPCTVILCDYVHQFPYVKAIFERYHIPFGYIQDQVVDHLPKQMAALIQFGLKKDIDSFLNCLQLQSFVNDCPQSVYLFLKDTQCLDLHTHAISLQLHDPIFQHDLKYIRKQEALWSAFYAQIEEIYMALWNTSSFKDIVKIVYEYYAKNISKEQHGTMLKIHELLSPSFDDLQLEDQAMVIDRLQALTSYTQDFQNDFCMVTDLQHQLPASQVAYVVGCLGGVYPGFSPLHGVFDEEYVQTIEKYPSLTKRYDRYQQQLKWIEHSAKETIYYSYYTADYQGRGQQIAYQIEALINEQDEQQWQLASQWQPYVDQHVIEVDYPSLLKKEDGKIHGSISTIERFFGCPYQYFLDQALHIRSLPSFELNAAVTGTLQHRILEQLIDQLFVLDDASLQQAIEQIIDDCYRQLALLNHQIIPFLSISKMKMVQGMMNSIAFLKDLHRHSSLKPSHLEWIFQQELIDGLILHGVIDRIDENEFIYRIIDYKSSDHRLQESRIQAGLQLQLLTYMMIYGKVSQKQPTSVLYYSLKQPNISLQPYKMAYGKVALIEENAQEQMIQSRKMHGWLFSQHVVENDDDEKHLSFGRSAKPKDALEWIDVIESKYQEFMQRIEQGDIGLTPVEGACTFCDYRPICRFHGEYRKIQQKQKEEA